MCRPAFYFRVVIRFCVLMAFATVAAQSLAIGPARGLNTLPSDRPITMGYMNALRSATGAEVSYTPSQLVTEIAGINWLGFDVVVHAFAEPLADGTVGEGLGNFAAYQSALITEAHARGKSVILSIGGAYPARLSDQFAVLAASPTLRQTFAQNVVAYLQANGYDGVDIDWEFPDYQAGGKANMTLLMQTLHAAVKAADANYLVMFGTGPGYYLGSYDFGVLSAHTDFFFYFGYDWKNPANGPMTKPGSVQWTNANDTLPEASVKGGLQYVMGKGFPASKIICGLPFYGSANRSWSSVRDTWAANRAGYLAAIDANSMEVQIGGEWFTTPDCMARKMDAVLKPGTSVLPGNATVRGVGTWEIGHEHRTHPDLSMAFAEWLAAYTGSPLVPVINVSDASVAEGNSGTATLAFTVTPSLSSSSTVTVNYATAEGTAAAGSDYAHASGTLTFAPGGTSKVVNVMVNGDTVAEPNEALTLTLSSPTNGTLGRATATGTILNDEPLPVLSIAGTTVVEGSSGSTNADLVVMLSPAAASNVTVHYATLNGSAMAGSDYTAKSGTLTFAPGETSKTTSIVVLGDGVEESSESFSVVLSSLTGATIGTATGTVTIPNDDLPPGATVEVGSPGWTRHYDQTASALEVTWNTPTGGAVWSTGFSGEIQLKNNDTAALSAWTLEFDAPWTTTGSGNAGSWAIAAGHHTVRHPTWQGYSTAAGATLALDFTGNGTWSVPTNIRVNGQPLGVGDPNALTFAAWGAPRGITAPTGDADHDGLANVVEFLTGSDPALGNGLALQPALEMLTVESVADRYFTLRVPAQFHSKSVEYRVETSDNLTDWKAGTGVMVPHAASAQAPGGMLEALWRSAQPVAGTKTAAFARLAVRQVGGQTTPVVDPDPPIVVTPGAPYIPSLSVQKDWADNVGYKVDINLWSGPAATSWKLYENGVVVRTGMLTGATPQNVLIDINEERYNIFKYKVEVTNELGTTPSVVVTYLAGLPSPIAIAELDPVRQATVTTVPQGVSTFTLQSGVAPFTVAVNHASVLSASITGNTLQLSGLSAGRSGVKITDANGDTRLFGVKVRKADGSLPDLPEYVSVGSVSEDDADLAFFADFRPDLRNRWVDYRYLYMNGGVKRRGVGWRVQGNVDGSRMRNFVRESVKLGMIPVVVWYNIPDGGESYTTDKEHMQDEDYMQGYFEDLKFAIDIANHEAGSEKVIWVLEPDFIGYMAQNHENPVTLMAQTNAAYDVGVLTAGIDPAFPDTMKGLIEAVNYTIKKYSNNCYMGWQFNLWAFPAGGWNAGSQVGVKGLMRVTDDRGITAGRVIVRNEGLSVADYYMSAGILAHGADFVSVDKYGLDGGAELKNNNPVESTWFWNGEHWGNYLHYVAAIHERTARPVMLWQLPVGHINHSLIEDPYNPGQVFPDLTNEPRIWEDSSPDYFLGNTFIPGAGNRYNWFSQNRVNDPGIVLHADGQTITWNPHMVEARNAGATILLFGDGVGNSTSGRGQANTDSFWWITRTQSYYLNPVPLSP